MKTHDLSEIRQRVSKLESRANASVGSFNKANIGVGRYLPGASPWERHNNGDELLFILDGEVHIEVLDGGSSFKAKLSEGTLFTVPSGLWHQLVAEAPVHIMYVSPSEDGAERTRDDPRDG